ncbi:MAG: NlpC/P60 family protein [Acidimicrobiales bacterium]
MTAAPPGSPCSSAPDEASSDAGTPRHRRGRAGGSPRRRLVAATIALGLVSALATGTGTADEVGDKRAEAAAIATKLQSLTEQQIQRAEDFNQANLRLEQADHAIEAAQHRVDDANAEVEAGRRQVRAAAVEAYLSGNDSPTMDVLLTSTADQAPQKKGYLDAASGNRQDAIDRLAATRQHLEHEIADLEQARSQAEQARQDADEARRQGEAAVAEQQALQAKVQGELAGLVQQEQARQAEARRQQTEADLRSRGAGSLADANAGGGAATAAPGTTGTTAGGSATTGSTAGQPGTTAGAPAPTAAPTTARPAPAPAPAPAPVGGSGKGGAAASVAMGQLGVPYVFGGASPRGFDCSGLVMWAYAQVGVSLPHATTAQWAATKPISMSELQVGDLIFFYGLGHVGIYIGGGRVVHAPHTGDVVRIEQVANMPVTGARRV